MHTRRSSLTRLLHLGLVFAGSLIAASVAHAQAQFAGTYVGTINIKVTIPALPSYPATESTSGFYSVLVSSSGAVDMSSGTLTGTVNANGDISFTGGSALATLGITTGKITGTQLTSVYGNVVGNGTTQFKLNGSTSFTAAAGTGGGGGGGGGTTVTAYANGSFEGGPNPGSSWITLASGSTVINNWTVTSGTIDYMGTAWAASNGTRSIDLSGASAGAIAQTFVTVPATTYTVTFDFAGNPGYGNGTGVKKMRVSVNNAGAASQEYTFDTTGRTLANMGWTTQTFTFVPTSTSTTLTFTSLENSAYGPALDNVRINGSIGDTGTGATTSITTTVSGTTATNAPANLTSYRNKVGATYEFTVTGATAGAVWGTDVYTDDSSVAAAAVHAGVIVAGQTKVLTISILPGQSSYTGSARNGVTTASWGAWTGSYSFAGSTSSIGTTTTVPQLSVDLSTINIPRVVSFGSPYVLSIPISGVGPFTYQWFLNGVAISGATSASYSIPSVSAANSGTYTLRVTNVAGSNTFQAGSISVAGSVAGVPVINLQPLNKIVSPGGTFALATNATGAGLSYQWYRNNVALTGETGSIILRNSANAGDAGNYTVRVTNSSGSITSNAGVVTLDPNASVISNLSVRVATTAMSSGFTIAGGGKKRVLIRAVGPGLVQFGIPANEVMPDPKVAIFENGVAIAGLSNDNWSTGNASSTTFAAVGAFGLTAGSKDSAVVVELDASASGRGYTAEVTNTGGGGVVLLEIYDLGNVTGASKFTNVSVRSDAGTGSSTLILGVSLRGTGQSTLLVRGIGPTLSNFGVGGFLVDPKLTVIDSNQRTIISNNDWGQADYLSELSLASNFVGAFQLQNQSKDAATLALLDAGTGYTIQVVGQDGGVGNALIEIYEVP